MGCRKLTYNPKKETLGEQPGFSWEVYKKEEGVLKKRRSYYRYGYQGAFSEEDSETGWNSFELRMYDSEIGRWTSLDPERQYHSPYNGNGNNPMRNIDPTGGVNPVVGSDGRFRGYDEFGAEGEVIVYDGAFTDGMSQAEIFKNGGLLSTNFFIENNFTVGEAIDFAAIVDYSHKQYEQHAGLINAGEDVQEVAKMLLFMSGGGGGSKVSSSSGISARGIIAGENIVYLSTTGKGVVQYVGITNNLARRAAEHLASKGINIKPLLQNLSRSDARAVEQALIEIHGLSKNGGTLINKINSIAAKNPHYADLLKRGNSLLKSVGY